MTTAGARGRVRCLRRCRDEGRAALVGYLPGRLPRRSRARSRRCACSSRPACDVVEVGVPYSDPLMDGPVIQHAAATALAGGTRVDDVFRATPRGARRRAHRRSS